MLGRALGDKYGSSEVGMKQKRVRGGDIEILEFLKKSRRETIKALIGVS